MQAVCELPQSGSGEIMAYVAYAMIGMMLIHAVSAGVSTTMTMKVVTHRMKCITENTWGVAT